MKVLTGKVINGNIVVEDDSLAEGSIVTIVAPEDDADRLELTADQEEQLRLSLAEADRGDVVDGYAMLEELKNPRR
jgi:hypothetical protein